MKVLCITTALIAICTSVKGEWPCPIAEAIAPCICTEVDDGGSIRLEMECSGVTSEEELDNSFNQTFPFVNFFSLTIRHAQSNDSALTSLSSGVFRDVTFEIVDIGQTKIETIAPDVFSESEPKLKSLVLSSNMLTSDSSRIDLSRYEKLEVFDLSSNLLAGSCSISSTSVKELSINNQEITTLVLNTPNLVNLYAKLNYLGSIPDLSHFDNLQTLDLSYNHIGDLGSNAFGTAVSAKYFSINLNGNIIRTIEPDSFNGILFDSTSKLQMASNRIDVLLESSWSALLSDKTGLGTGKLDLTDNPLLCGCDVLWIVSDAKILDRINPQTTCSDGSTLLINVDPVILQTLCARHRF